MKNSGKSVYKKLFPALAIALFAGISPMSAHAQMAAYPYQNYGAQPNYYSGYPSYFGVNGQSVYNPNLPMSGVQYPPADYPPAGYGAQSLNYYTQNTPASYYPQYSQTSSFSVATQQPVRYIPLQQQAEPYVTLTQVPYTGLDLGPWGTFWYWTFLILWCLFMAYLIAVKRVHYTLANAFSAFLFGADEEEEEEDSVETMPARSAKPAAAHASHGHTMVLPTYVAAKTEGEDPVDEFVLSQVHRVA